MDFLIKTNILFKYGYNRSSLMGDILSWTNTNVRDEGARGVMVIVDTSSNPGPG